MSMTARVAIARPKRPAPVLICGKCLRKAEHGKAVRRELKRALAEAAEAADERRKPPKLVRTSCMGLCPKRAVALASGASLARGEMLIVSTPAQIRSALELL